MPQKRRWTGEIPAQEGPLVPGRGGEQESTDDQSCALTKQMSSYGIVDCSLFDTQGKKGCHCRY
eukprot:11194511-Lingulodinium_polyedra.AAC.1